MSKIWKILGFGGAVAVVAGFSVISLRAPYEASYNRGSLSHTNAAPVEVVEKVKHLKTPEPLKAVYMTQCVAATPSFRDKVVKLIDDTEINAVVIDIKDYTGTVSFLTGDPEIDDSSGQGCRALDMKEFIERLHNKNIYVIGRLAVFQDPLYSKAHPELAVQKKSGGIWKDRKGLSFIDVGAKPFWEYIIKISKYSYDTGFDEINFDYIRFPSDGNMDDITFPHTGSTTKKEMLKKFFEYLDGELSQVGVITSADLFGMTTTNTDDLGIGQILEYAMLNFDYIAPMVYPSHYPPEFNGWPDPNKVPYEIVKFSMDEAVARNNFLRQEVISAAALASSTPSQKMLNRLKPTQLRPWLQDNDYPVHYTPAMVRAQIEATYDAGLTSWMLWDPGNTYTREALLQN
jgi:hypothetical protein